MFVPSVRLERHRSSSPGSIRTGDSQTMEPRDKFVAPRLAPSVTALPDFLGPAYRLPIAPAIAGTSDRALSRSISPTPSRWSPRKLFTRKHSNSSQGSGSHVENVSFIAAEEKRGSIALSSTPTELSSRTISPESLRRFLTDDASLSEHVATEEGERLARSIPDDLAEDDDDDFFTSRVSELGTKTVLSPPPVNRHNPFSTRATTTRGTSSKTPMSLRAEAPTEERLLPRQYPESDTEDDTPVSRFSLSSEDLYSDVETEVSHIGTDIGTLTFYFSDMDEDDDDDDDDDNDDDNDDDDDDGDCYLLPQAAVTRRETGRESLEQSLALALDRYLLPRDGDVSNGCIAAHETAEDASVTVGNSSSLMALPAFDNFASQLTSDELSF